jgi:hypothetical protein
MDPISSGQLTREEIARAETDPLRRLHLQESKIDIPQVKTKRGPRYTPVSRRHDRPNAVLWLLRNHPELKDSQLMRLVGTTKPTILQIRERSHWNSANLVPQDPVTLGLCSQTDLDAEVRKAAKRVEKERGPQPIDPDADKAGTLLPTADTTGYRPAQRPEAPVESEAEEAKRILARLKGLTGGADADEDGVEADAEAGEEAHDHEHDGEHDHDHDHAPAETEDR